MLQPQRPQQLQLRRQRPQPLQRRRHLYVVDRKKGIDAHPLLAFYPFWMIVRNIFNVNGDDLLNDHVDRELISMHG